MKIVQHEIQQKYQVGIWSVELVVEMDFSLKNQKAWDEKSGRFLE
jgi:hypothetical protein